jgi:UDP-glucose 4-epimerase
MALEKHTKVLVTGAGGLIGYAVAEHLHSQGYDVVGVVRRPSLQRYPFETYVMDLSQTDFLYTKYFSAKVDSIVHCAAYIPREGENLIAARMYNHCIENNIQTIKVSENAHVILMSGTILSASIGYQETSLRENSNSFHNSWYLYSKYEAEVSWSKYQDSVCILRIPSPFGMRQTNKNVLKLFIDRALEGEPLRYHGTGMREQNFISAHDIALAVERALQTSAKGIFNIASDRAISMKELAELICTAAQPTASIVEPSGQPDEQDHIRVRIPIEKAWQELGWKPSTNMLSELQEIISHRRREVHE